MSEEECEEVRDILNMYQALTRSYQNLKDKAGIGADEIRFAGFAGNNETDQYSYAQYLIVDLSGFEELRQGDFNSHSQKLHKYRRMLSVWKEYKEYKEKFNLDKDQIRKILDA